MGGWNPLEDSWGFGTGGWEGLKQTVLQDAKDYFQAEWDLNVKIAEESFRLLGLTGQTIYTVQVVNQQIIPEAQTPFPHKILMNHVLNGTSISAGFQLSLTTGIHASVKRYLRYGENHYVNGVPTLTNSVTGIPQGAVDDALTDVEGAAVTVFTAVITYLPQNEWVKWWLQENTTFTYHNGQITAHTSVYEYTGITDTGSNYTANFDWLSGNIGDPTTYLVTGIPYEDDTKAYVLATYSLDSAPTETKIWIYDRDDGTYPDLDPVDESGVQDSTILPIVPIRRNFVSLDDPAHAVEYESARRLLNKLELRLQHLIDSLEDPDDATQLAQIEDAFVYFGLNIYSENVSTIRALRETFSYFEQVQTTDKDIYDQQSPTSNPTPNVFTVEEGTYNISLQWNYILTVPIVGSIGSIGFADKTITILPNTVIVDNPDPDSDETYGGLAQSYIVIREQITETIYLETTIHGLTQASGITTSPGNIKYQFSELEIESATRASFMVPLIMSAISDLAPVQQEEILYEAITLTVYAVSATALEYYETSQFLRFVQIVIIVVTIVIAIYSGGSGAEIAWNLFQNLLYQYALSLALKEIMKHNLSDSERALAIALYVVAAVYGASGFNFDFSTLQTADTYMFAVNSVTDALMMDQAIQLEQLAQDTEQLIAAMQQRQEMLDAANSTLSRVHGVDPLMLIRTNVVDTYESPGQFYERTIHTGNPGVLTLDQIDNFYDKALELPQLT